MILALAAAAAVPLTTPMTTVLELEIVGFAALYSIVAILIQRVIVDTKKMRELNLQVRELQKEMNELVKSKAPQEHIMNKNKEMMPLLSETMKKQMKPMLVLLPLSLIVYGAVVPFIFAGAKGTYIDFIWKLSYTTFFIVSLFIIGFVIAMFVQVYDKKKALEERKAAREASQTNAGST
jgi:uncharacterized membrane protein (DUF106 family)